MARTFVAELTEQQALDQTFRTADKQLRVNRQGGKYILMKLADRTGIMTAMMWNAEEPVFDSFQSGDYVRCKGRTQLYNGNLQVIVTDLTRVEESEINPQDYDRFDSSTAERNFNRLKELLGGIQDVYLHRLGEIFLEDELFVTRLKKAPAAVSNHHAYPGGLLQHTVDLMELAQAVGPKYPHVDFERVMFGAFLHDLGKIEELSANESSTYTDRGQLIGHIVIGVQMLADKIAATQQALEKPFPQELRWQLEHLILSHHGQMQFGSPKVPLTLEALALHHLDNLDAKITAATTVIEADVAPEGNWTNYNASLGCKMWNPGASGR